MSGGGRPLAWLLLAVWLAWTHALQALLASSPLFAGATPDLGTIFLVCLAPAMRRADVPFLALLAAFARKSASIEPAVAILLACLVTAGLASSLRSMMELHGPLWRAGLAVVGSCGLALWLAVVRAARGEEPPRMELVELLPLAATSGLTALALGGLFLRLPGLGPLRARRSAW